ncbi:Uncharacterised protein [uncultured archaeon]|nr:Uncharacterised protein [uncultured archaeon]
MKKTPKRLVLITILVLVFLVLLLFAIRVFSSREIDDVTPGIYCEPEYLEKAQILWVIPNYNNTPISQNETWCEKIISMNKTLGMHGVRHQPYEEFKIENKTQEEFQKGIKIFEDCFNQTPTRFKSPQLALSQENKKMILENFPDLKIKSYFNQITHKVYHCSDTGRFSNRIIDLF